VTSNSTQNPGEKDAVIYQFGPFRFDTRQGVLLRDGKSIKIAPKTLQLLRLLIENNGQVVDKGTIMKEVWPDSFVEEANLTVHISNIRKMFNGSTGEAGVIETFPKVGYRYTGNVSIVEASESNGISHDVLASVPPAEKKTFIGRWATYSLIGLIVLLAGTVVGWRYFVASSRERGPEMIRVPGTENGASIALSPNGEFLAQAVSRFGKRALSVTNIISGSSVQIVEPSPALYWGMKFTRDSSYLYFIKEENQELTLNKIPVLGGQSSLILRNPGINISFAPDGTKFCFLRKTENDSAVFIANADGTDEERLSIRTKPLHYSSGNIAWSPDGKTIAVLGDTDDDHELFKLTGVDAVSGRETILSDSKWASGDGLAWLPDSSAIVAGLFETSASPTHVWMIPLDTGIPKKITSDTANYGGVDISADGKTILAGQFHDESSLWLQPYGNPMEAKPITNEKHHNFKWVRWAGDHQVIFGSSAGSNRDVWRMDVDGTNEAQLTANARSNIMPAAGPDGESIYFCSNRENPDVFDLFRASSTGENVTRLTSGVAVSQPAVSPDGKWVYVTSGNPDTDRDQHSVWRVPSTGSELVRFCDKPSYGAAVSPDSRFVAFWVNEPGEKKWRVAIANSSDGHIINYLPIPPSNSIKWLPDGSGISYIATADGVSNIWSQPIKSGPPVQETRFTSDTIENFDWSPAGELICSHSGKTRDAFLIRNFR
jgi:DNA-binding winged helix-turn-helix (wHTH) protein/Tol biopolymer transport system component